MTVGKDIHEKGLEKQYHLPYDIMSAGKNIKWEEED